LKLKQKDLPAYRKQLIKDQNNICPLSGKEHLESEMVLDHCHDTGVCRMALSRMNNQVEGRIKSWLHRGGHTSHEDKLTFIKNLVRYWEKDFSDNIIHPTHKTAEDKELKKLKKKVKTLKRQSAIDKANARIAELKQIIKEG
jgi:hypothetical protein